jgi:undecaprenyl diphosphate synthase
MEKFSRLPRHIGFIPDGNRRWAVRQGLPKEAGYQAGLKPAFRLYKLCIQLGIEEVSVYGFTKDNTHRTAVQTKAFRASVVDAVKKLSTLDAFLRVVGDSSSPLFPKELLPYTKRVVFGKGLIKVNFLANYDWEWDLNYARSRSDKKKLIESIGSSDVSRIDLIVRWGERRRLSGFLPIQSVYADFYFVNALWPDFKPQQFYNALHWYEEQDITLGG